MAGKSALTAIATEIVIVAAVRTRAVQKLLVAPKMTIQTIQPMRQVKATQLNPPRQHLLASAAESELEMVQTMTLDRPG